MHYNLSSALVETRGSECVFFLEKDVFSLRVAVRIACTIVVHACDAVRCLLSIGIQRLAMLAVGCNCRRARCVIGEAPLRR